MAVLAPLRARVDVARMLGDRDEEHAAAGALADALVRGDRELDTAVELATRALATREDPVLRIRLAGWLEKLGEPVLAAAELRRLPDEEEPVRRTSRLVRIGVLHARGGDAGGAIQALLDAAASDPADALPLELLATLPSWASDVVSARDGSDAYAQAARRRGAEGDPELELEDLLRAVELDPASPVAVAALASRFAKAARIAAADLVLRRHADARRASGEEHEAEAVHEQRLDAALATGDLGRALFAAFDAGMDGVFEGATADAFDALLSRAGAHELVAARLSVRAERAEGRAASTRWAELGRLCAGPLAANERALEAYSRAVAADPTNTDALHALKALARRTGGTTWLVEGLVRAALAPAAPAAAARALAEVAEHGRDPLLACWAQGVLLAQDPADEDARAAIARHETALRRRDEEVALARRALETSADSAKVGLLGDLVRLLRSAPDASKELAKVLAELSAVHRDDDLVLWEALRLAERAGDVESVLSLCRARLARPPEPPRLRIALVSALRRAGRVAESREAAEGLASAVTPWGFAEAWVTARVAGDTRGAALALAEIAPTCGPPAAAALGTIAADALAREGDEKAARRAAELASRADPDDPRTAATLAALVPTSAGRVAASAIEHAIETGYATSKLCARLADVLEASGDKDAAIAWAKRSVTLRPGFGTAVEALVARAIRLGDLDAAALALDWLLPQPEPSKVMAERIGSGLRAIAEHDAERACEAARRALDVLGPRSSALRDAVTEAARKAGDHALQALLLERWLAAGAPAAARADGMFELGALYATLGDTSRELSAYVRAAREGVDLTRIEARLATLDPAKLEPDAELSLLEVSAELALDQGRTDDAIAVFRDLGAAFWDLADDRARAVQSWMRAAQLDSARGYATLRKDLVEMADAGYAASVLADLAERETDRPRCALIATEAARAALEADEPVRALSLARTALEKHAGHAEALELAERASRVVGRAHEMSPLYDHVARRALGRFGRRAAHHRAARYFADGGVAMLALKHAAQAFIAVPSEGSTLELLRRTSDQAQRRSIAVRTVEHVAELSKSSHLRAAWLLRAAEIAGRDLEGIRQRVDLLLRAAVLVPSPVTMGMLETSARELLGFAPEDAEALAVRLARASDALAKELEGPDGARIAILFGRMALDLFGDASWAIASLERAMGTDADVDEYARLVPSAAALARAPDGRGQALLDVAFRTIEQPYANVGVALLRLVGAVALALGDGARAAKALVMAVEKDGDDDDAVAEADEALRTFEDHALAERFARKADRERRFEALRRHAERARARGEHEVAAAALSRARDLAPEGERSSVDRELSSALGAAGRVEEAVELAVASEAVPEAERAARWEELGRAKEAKGDPDGAVLAYVESARLAGSAERWACVERTAESAEREDLRLEALRGQVEHVGGGERREAQKRVARAEGARGALGPAETAWREVWQSDPSDDEPDVAIEALLVARSDYARLADHLADRITRLAGQGAAAEALRAVRLRRAAILEQRLTRLDDAVAELERVLVDTPGHASALRWLADLYERLGQPSRALPVLEELARTGAPSERRGASVRRARALLQASEVERAREVVRELVAESPSSVSLLELRIEVARAAGDPTELGEALEALSRLSPDDARTRSEMLVEAAQAAARAGDTEASLRRARDAARLAPDVPSTQLFARGLEYRIRGAGGAEDAGVTVSALAPIVLGATRSGLAPEDVALGTFLLAEARDVLVRGSGEPVLRDALGEVGAQPLIALGLAERAAAKGTWEPAIRFYVQALEGNLLGLRRVGRVALAASDAAVRAGRPDVEARLLEEAALDPETRVEALRRQAAAARTKGDVGSMRELLRSILPALEGDARADVLAELARALFESTNPADRIEADRTLREAVSAASPERAMRLRAELGGFRTRPPSSAPVDVPPPPSDLDDAAPQAQAAETAAPVRRSAPPLVPSRPPPLSLDLGAASAAEARPSVPPAPIHSSAPPPVPLSLPPAPRRSSAPPLDATPAPPLVAMLRPSSPPTASVLRDVEAARAALARGDREQAEGLLSGAMRAGSLAAADLLDDMLQGDRQRSPALVKVRRHAVELAPGDVVRLGRLRDAARADQNSSYVHAIEHVLRIFDAEQGPLPPPPLAAQSPSPGMMGMLARHSQEPAGEVFACVWEGAKSQFVKPLATYGTSGLERVQPGPASSVSRLYEMALRLLDTPRFALFHKKTKDPLSYGVAFLESPSAVLTGEPKDETELKWVFGKALAAVLPENALPIGLPDEDGALLWRVLVSAFGPAAVAKPFDKLSASVADRLWQTLTPRAQRRIGERLEKCAAEPFELVLERAKQSGRRVGMFLSGDFGHAARALLAELPGRDARELATPADLSRLCNALPSLADLFRLAVRPEYADARWHLPAPTSQRFSLTGGLPVV